MAKTHRGETNKTHEIELTSTLDQVVWTRRVAAPGGKVGLEVFTTCVGNGAELKIELSDHGGKNHGTFKDHLVANRMYASIQIPSEARDALYADVKLPKHGLHQKSPALLLLPPIEIKNAKWDKQEARRGDILKLSADVEGAPDGAEASITIWEHDADEAHDLITKLPVLVHGGKVEVEWEYEYHEDTDEIPTDEEAERGYNPPEYFFIVEVSGVTGESELLEFKDWIEFEILAFDGRPLADTDCTVVLADGTERQSRTDQDGLLTLRDMPPGPYEVRFGWDPEAESSDEDDTDGD